MQNLKIRIIIGLTKVNFLECSIPVISNLHDLKGILIHKDMSGLLIIPLGPRKAESLLRLPTWLRLGVKRRERHFGIKFRRKVRLFFALLHRLVQARKGELVMKKIILLFLLGAVLSGCVNEKDIKKEQEQENILFAVEEIKVGRVGDQMPITRAQGAKMIAMAFYEPKELLYIKKKSDFKDVKETDWFFPYINGVYALKIMAGEGEFFYPHSPITLAQTQTLMDKLNSDNHTKIKITEENKEKPVSYSLWMELFQETLQERRGEDSLYSYGMQEQELVLLEQADNETILTSEGMFQQHGYVLKGYENRKMKVLVKEKIIVALLEVLDMDPVIENAYLRKKEGGIEIDTGSGKKIYAYGGDIPEEKGFIGDIHLEKGKAIDVVTLENSGKDIIKKVDESNIFLEKQGNVSWDAHAKIYEEKGEKVLRRKGTRLLCGTDIADFYERDGKVCAAVIRRKATPHRIRVLLSKTGFQGYEHETVILTASEDFTMWGGAEKKEYKGGQEATLTLDQDEGLFQKGRVYVKTKDGGVITLKSVSKNDGAPSYAGILELEKGKRDLSLSMNCLWKNIFGAWFQVKCLKVLGWKH